MNKRMDHGSKEGVKPWESQTDSDWDGGWRKQGAKEQIRKQEKYHAHVHSSTVPEHVC